MQMYKRLFIFVEGDDDVRFFDKIIKPLFERKYDYVFLWDYAQEPPKRIRRFIDSINAMSSDDLLADYILATDINNAPCITYRKQAKQDKLNNIDKRKIIVLKKEIESWYLAGLDDVCSRKCGISHCNTTDNITKEQFNKLTPIKFKPSRIDFCQEILKYFQLETAKQKNKSFRYLITKYEVN